jgi:hypothetical protein
MICLHLYDLSAFIGVHLRLNDFFRLNAFFRLKTAAATTAWSAKPGKFTKSDSKSVLLSRRL